MRITRDATRMVLSVLGFLSLRISCYLTPIISQFHFKRHGLCTQPSRFVDADSHKSFQLKNVLGDGDCVFRAIRLLTNNATVVSRQHVAECFVQNTTLYITTENHTVSGHLLLRKAAADLNVSIPVYLEWLRQPGRQGGLYAGGPELTVLSNLLQRNICVYEPVSSYVLSNATVEQVMIERKGVFGTVFDCDPSRTPLNIFIVDTGGSKHACALLPCDD